jgi:hypothetical protein
MHFKQLMALQRNAHHFTFNFLFGVMGVEMGLHTFLALYVEPVPSSAQSTRLRA